MSSPHPPSSNSPEDSAVRTSLPAVPNDSTNPLADIRIIGSNEAMERSEDRCVRKDMGSAFIDQCESGGGCRNVVSICRSTKLPPINRQRQRWIRGLRPEEEIRQGDAVQHPVNHRRRGELPEAIVIAPGVREKQNLSGQIEILNRKQRRL